STAMPSTEEEVWRYSRVDDLDLDRYAPVPPEPDRGGEIPAGAQAVLDAVVPRAGAIVVRNGRVVHAELEARWVDKGVRLGSADEADDEARVGVLIGEPGDLFGLLNDAHSADPLVVVVPRGVTVDEPLVVIDWVDADGAATFPRLVVQLGENAEATVLEHHGGDDVDALVVPITELDVGPAARLRYLNVQERGPRTWQIATQASRVDRDGTLVAAQAALGGEYARTRADCRLVGRGATGDLLAIYFGERNQTMDFRTFQDHVAPDTTSNLLFKGALGGQSRSVYTGLIRVRPDARGTNAFQTNRTIKLSEDAWAESVPNLEIENNDVHCSHASTVGPIDEDQRFYLESRGVPPEVAEQLVVAGFFDEVLTTLPVSSVVAPLRARIVERLERRDRVVVSS
ncbi:MAG TPA: Fe-S cluster assembly protein SufD, partial [Acidimicrobiales bacterium]